MVNGGEERGEAGSDRRDGVRDREGRSSLQTKCRRWRSSSFSGAGKTTKTTELRRGFFCSILMVWGAGGNGGLSYQSLLCDKYITRYYIKRQFFRSAPEGKENALKLELIYSYLKSRVYRWLEYTLQYPVNNKIIASGGGGGGCGAMARILFLYFI